MDKQKIKKPAVNIEDKAIIEAKTKKTVFKKSAVYTDDYGVKYQFVKPKLFLMQRALAHLKKLVNENKPQPPLQMISGKKQPNKKHPEYLRDLRLWEKEKEEIENEESLGFVMLYTIVVKLLSPIPPKELWIDDVITMLFAGLGSDEEKANLLKSTYRTEEQMIEFLYKKFVLIDSEDTMKNIAPYMDFSAKETEGVNSELAVDTFRTKT